MGLNISKMWFWIDTLGLNLKETLIFNWNVIQFGALWAGNLLRHFLMIVELSVIPTNDSLIIRLNYLNLSFTLFLSSTVVSWTAALNSAKSCWAFGVEGLIQNKHKWNVLCNLPRNFPGESHLMKKVEKIFSFYLPIV